MKIQKLVDADVSIQEVLDATGSDGTILEVLGKKSFVLIPMDDDVLDFLLERNPKLIQDCVQIRDRLRSGHIRSHDEVKTQVLKN